MMTGSISVQQLAEQYQSGSFKAKYTRSGFGKYLIASIAIYLFVFAAFAYSGLLAGQGWLCLALLAAGPIFVGYLAFRARNWGIYAYSEGFIYNEGHTVGIVYWHDIVSLETGCRTTSRLSLSEITTYTVTLKDGSSLILTSDYEGIADLLRAIEDRLVEAKYQDYAVAAA
ncbi:MAG TPA: DUF6585 family protein [Ktedonobacteraceae bacterium]|nr:DUF6585 family protein [Ktedonobacteraceae bacterium]